MPDPPLWSGCALSTASAPIQIFMSPPADLEVTSINPPVQAYSGLSATFEWTVANHGAGATVVSSWNDAVYLSLDNVIDTLDISLGKFGHSGTLDVDASYTQNRSITLPNGISGNYYVCISTDSDNNAYEGSWENNNALCSSSTVDVIFSSPPNLQVTSVTPPQSASTGQTINLAWTISNTGAGSTVSTYWYDKVYFSMDETLDTSSDRYLGASYHSGALNAGDTYNQSQSVTIPGDLITAGTYYLFVVTDSDNQVYEYENENDNVGYAPIEISITPPPPPPIPSDLQVTSASIPTSASSGQPIPIQWTVCNNGTGSTSTSSWTDAVYLSQDNILGSDTEMGRLGHYGTLAVGGCYTQTANVTIPNGLSGAYYILIVSDSYNNVYEQNDNNNLYSSFIGVNLTEPSDLEVMLVNAPDTATSGQFVTVDWTVTNTALGVTNSDNWYDTVYLSKDKLLDGSDYKAGYLNHSGILNGGESYSASLDIQIPMGYSSPYYVFVVTDSNNKVYEYNREDNNTSYDSTAMIINLPPPADLVVSGVTAPSTGVPGQPASISWTVTNQGPNNADGQWWDSLYLSADTAWDVNDPKIATVLHNGTVSVGGTYTGSVNAALPPVVPGNYYVIVRTDIKNNIREANEGNNTGVSSGTISMDAIELTLGTPYSSQLSTGTEHYYKVNVPEGEDLLIILDSESAISANELYVRYNAMPDRIDFDYMYDKPFEADQEIVVSGTQAGVYYILVRGASVPEGFANYTITAQILEFAVRKISSEKGGNVGEVTIEISGAKFQNGISAELVSQDYQITTANKIYFIDGVKLYATFDLTGLTPGFYSIRLINPDSLYTEVPDVFEVVSGKGANLVARLIMPSSIRPGRDFTIWVEYENVGDVDMIPPLFVVSSPNGAPMSLYPDIITPIDSPVQLIGVSVTGPPGILRPGVEQSIPLYSNSTAVGTTMNFSLNSWLLSDRSATEWCSITTFDKPQNPPGTACGPDWSPEWTNTPGGFNFTEACERHDCCCACRGFLSAWKCGLEFYFNMKKVCDNVSSLQQRQACYRWAVLYQNLATYACKFNNKYCTTYCKPPGDTPTDPPSGPSDGGAVTVVVPRDPNDKVGPAGFEDEAFIATQSTLPFTINFENVPDATAPASQVRITDQLDADLDWRSFRLEEIAFGDTVIEIPENRSYYQTRIDLGAEYNNMLLDVFAGIDIQAGQVYWTLTTIDPATGEPPIDPLAGFLPPNDENHSGEGHVTFTIEPKTGLPTGTQITNKTSIIFDTNEPIETNEVFNTIDGAVPSSVVNALSAITEDTSFTVTWSGSDDVVGSGLASYDIYVSDNGAAYTAWQNAATNTSVAFTGEVNHTYRFYSIARDNAGNVKSAPTAPDATTTVVDYNADNDGDGYSVNQGDCDDTNPAINPGTTEVCDGIDNNCNGQIDEGVLNTYYRDADGDTYGNVAVNTQACTAPSGYVVNNTDCNDGNSSINPGTTEIINNGIDDDCNPATPIPTVSGVGMNSPSSKWRASMSVNVNGSGPSGTVKYYYTRQRINFVSSSILSVTASGGIATITGIGNATKENGSGCSGCSFTVTIVNGSPDQMGIEILNPDWTFYYKDPPSGGSRAIESGNFSVVGQ